MPRDMLVDFVDRDKILESGRLPSDKIENDIVEVLIYNNFYLKMEERGIFNLLKDVKLGDVIDITLENYDKTTGKIAYKNQKIKVVGFIDRVWDSFYDTEAFVPRSEEHTSELQSRQYLVCRLLLEKKTNSLHS